MNPQKTGGWRKNARKIAIVLVLIGSFWPPLAMNISIYAEQAGLSGPITRIFYNQQFPSFHALLLCQMWGLFSYISPFNYTLNYEVELTDGRIVALHDFKKEAAGKWVSILFHNEPKSDNNFYANHSALRQYMEYLIRTNGLDPSWVVRRTIFLRYRNVFPRDQAAKAGTYYGPETTSVIESY
jgi:hypothetical protein